MAHDESLVALNGTQVSLFWKLFLSDFVPPHSQAVISATVLKRKFTRAKCRRGFVASTSPVSCDTLLLTLQAWLCISLPPATSHAENSALKLQ